MTEKKSEFKIRLIRKSLLTFFYDKHPEMKEKLSTLMKHKRSIGEKWYYLNQTCADVAETLEKVTDAIFGAKSICSESKLNLVDPITI